MKRGTLKAYPARHGIYDDYQDQLDGDILDFIADQRASPRMAMNRQALPTGDAGPVDRIGKPDL